MAAGGQHTCAVTPAGALYCWGSNTYGQLGDGTTTDHHTPVAVAVPGGLTLANLTVGDQFSCLLATTGQPYCWGRNSFGQLGDGTTTDRITPVQVENPGGLRFVSLKAGTNHACAKTDGGAAYCWGSNANGQLGDGTTTDRSTPVPVSGGIVFNVVRPAAEHTCGIETGGQAYCWGWNNFGQLGDGTTTTRLTPVAVAGGFSFGAVYTGGNGFTCATDMTSRAYCWGLNNVGQLGDGTQTNRLTPVAVAGGLTLYVLNAGFAHVVAIGDGAAYAWGSNNFGQLGDGSTTQRTTPVLIVPPAP
jgi:alpha-tubulin suppressor-like RCC1 family protein